jgi:thymidylate synthase (FAD)
VTDSVVFKTIQECGLELVSYTVMNSDDAPCADFQPCSAARASFGKESKTGSNVEADKKLMGYLADNGHCYHPSMEVLTSRGWLRWDECNEYEDFVVPYPELKLTTTETCRVFNKDFDGQLETMETQRMCYKVTPDHNMLYKPKNRKGPFRKIPAKDLPNWGNFMPYIQFMPDDFHLDESELNLGRFLGFYLGDGYGASKNRVAFTLKKERKIDFLKGLLEKLNVGFSARSRDDGATSFYCAANDLLRLNGIDPSNKAADKRISIGVEDMSYSMRLGLWEGLANSDGSFDKRVKGRVHFCSASRHLLKLWEDLSSSLGNAVTWRTGANENRVVTSHSAGRTSLEARAQHFGKEEYRGKVYCTTTSSGWLIVRGNKHTYPFISGNCTPFEYNYATFLIEAPLFVHEQIKQHRSLYNLTMPNNAISRRYTSEQIGFWIPDKWRKQSSSNKQASTDEAVESMVVTDHVVREKWADDPMRVYTNQVKASLWLYEDMLESGICREQARAVLPQSLLTRFYLGGNLREWAMFLKLRTAKEGVQFETRYVAERIEKALRKLWPVATEKLFNQKKED